MENEEYMEEIYELKNQIDESITNHKMLTNLLHKAPNTYSHIRQLTLEHVSCMKLNKHPTVDPTVIKASSHPSLAHSVNPSYLPSKFPSINQSFGPSVFRCL